jgi:O-antigen/teichoic acid export membrane protein
MIWWGATPLVFFSVQLAISVVELGWLVARAGGCLPSVDERIGYSLAPLRSIARFSAAVAFTGALSVALTQSDRLLLSGLLPLGEYAHFNLAVLAASAVLLAGSPLTSALLPRLSAMQGTKCQDDVRRLALLATGLMSLATLPLAMMLAIHSHAVMLTWTGQAAAAQASANILALYALGNAIVAHLSLAYALQFASGNLRLHVIGNALLVAALIPGQLLLTLHYGAVGAGAFWLAINLLYALAWIPVVLRRVAPGVLGPWFAGIARAALAAAAAVGLTRLAWEVLEPLDRLSTLAFLVAGWLFASAATLALSAPLRRALADSWRRRAAGVA